MPFITRLTRILSADFHAVLDKLEEPEVLLKQAIREMEQDLQLREGNVKDLQQQRKRLQAQTTTANSEIQRLGQELDLCFASGNESLARNLIRRRLEAEGFVNHATELKQTLEENLSLLQTQLREDQLQLESLRQRAEAFSSGSETKTPDYSGGRFAAVSDDEIEVAFLKEKHQRASQETSA